MEVCRRGYAGGGVGGVEIPGLAPGEGAEREGAGGGEALQLQHLLRLLPGQGRQPTT